MRLRYTRPVIADLSGDEYGPTGYRSPPAARNRRNASSVSALT